MDRKKSLLEEEVNNFKFQCPEKEGFEEEEFERKIKKIEDENEQLNQVISRKMRELQFIEKQLDMSIEGSILNSPKSRKEHKVICFLNEIF